MNTKNLIAIVICFWTLLGSAQEQKMTVSEINIFKSNLYAGSKLKTLAADFTQYKKVGFVKKEMKSSGKFYVKNPDRLAWIYSSPMNYRMIFKDKKVFINDQGKTKNMNLSGNKQFEKISQAIQSNMGGNAYDGKDFVSTYYKTATQNILKLDPLGKEVKKSMKQIVLYFDKGTHLIAEVKLIDASNGYTRFILTNQKVNTTLTDSVFAF